METEAMALWNKMALLLVDVKNKYGNRRPDLSYTKK